MIHTSFFCPKYLPYRGAATVVPTEIDRLQELSASSTLNRTKIEELGREGLVDWKKATPSVSVTLRQLEYGSFEFWQQLANVASTDTKIEAKDFKTSLGDIAGYETDDDGTFLSTVWYPKLKLSGFGISIGDPDAIAERTFNLVGEDRIILKGTGKYLISLIDSASAVGHQIVIGSGGFADYPAPVEDQDNSGNYFLRCVRYRSSVATELTEGTDYTWDNGIQTITIDGSADGDVYRYIYSAASYITDEEPFTANDSDLASITADSVSIYLGSGSEYLYKLQSVSCDVSLDRFDVREIGNGSVVKEGARDITTNITLGRILEDYTVDQVLRGEGSTYRKLDIKKFIDELTLVIKFYSDDGKGIFKCGMKWTDLAPASLDDANSLNDYSTSGISMVGESMFLTSDENEL